MRIRCFAQLFGLYLQVCVSLSTPSFTCAMLVTQLVALAAIAIVDGTRVSIQGNLAAAKEQDLEPLSRDGKVAEGSLGKDAEHPVSQFLEEYLKRNQAIASLQEEQLAKTKEFLQTLLQDEKTAAEEHVAEASAPPTTTMRGHPEISLELAARNGDVAALAAWHQAGADLSAELDSDLSGWTPAHYAAREGHAAALKFLQEAGADLQKVDDNKRTPVHMAAYFGNVEALRVLIEAGVNLNVKDIDGDTPADDAKSHEEALKLILEAGGKRSK
eukprot:s639_g10.t1